MQTCMSGPPPCFPTDHSQISEAEDIKTEVITCSHQLSFSCIPPLGCVSPSIQEPQRPSPAPHQQDAYRLTASTPAHVQLVCTLPLHCHHACLSHQHIWHGIPPPEPCRWPLSTRAISGRPPGVLSSLCSFSEVRILSHLALLAWVLPISVMPFTLVLCSLRISTHSLYSSSPPRSR